MENGLPAYAFIRLYTGLVAQFPLLFLFLFFISLGSPLIHFPYINFVCDGLGCNAWTGRGW